MDALIRSLTIPFDKAEGHNSVMKPENEVFLRYYHSTRIVEATGTFLERREVNVLMPRSFFEKTQ
jgi:hypothetical protein